MHACILYPGDNFHNPNTYACHQIMSCLTLAILLLLFTT